MNVIRATLLESVQNKVTSQQARRFAPIPEDGPSQAEADTHSSGSRKGGRKRVTKSSGTTTEGEVSTSSGDLNSGSNPLSVGEVSSREGVEEGEVVVGRFGGWRDEARGGGEEGEVLAPGAKGNEWVCYKPCAGV